MVSVPVLACPPDTGPMLALACPPDSLRSSMVGGDGLEPPTLSV
jgi:hypothetical protein